jgi:gliding-associated putative ABC transporter substrate-binding component GldG
MVKNHKLRNKLQSYSELLVVVFVVVLANVLANQYYKRFDLTAEKRYTLSATSEKLCGQIKDRLYVKVYLDGEMSSKFKRFRNELRDLLYEFREASGQKIDIDFTDPLEGKDNKEKSNILTQMEQRGLIPVRDFDREGIDETSFKLVVPGADVVYQGKEFSVNFFLFDVAKDPETNVNQAIQGLEYELANMVRRCIAGNPKKIIIADGSGELDELQTADFSRELSQYYQVERMNLNVADPEAARPFQLNLTSNPDSAGLVLLELMQRRLNSADGLVIAKPRQDYTDAELYLIDQFIMKGGKVLWMVDPVSAEIDSLERNPSFLASNQNLDNITAQLFEYGVSLNPNLLMDATCNRIPTPRREFFDWYYFPLFTSRNLDHPIVKNLGAVWSQFPATLRAKSRPDVKITDLLVSSPYTKTVGVPATIDYVSTYMQSRDPKFRETMNSGLQSCGVLLEGTFRSPFVFRRKLTSQEFIKETNNSMIVIADGDIARNGVMLRSGNPYPLGYDRFSRITFSNKKFLMNCVDYLLDQNGLIEIRGKELNVRLLDQTRIKDERAYWKWLNMLLPLLMILIFGGANWWIRRWKYTRTTKRT